MIRPPRLLYRMAGVAIGLALLSVFLSIPQLRSEAQYKKGVQALMQGNYAQARRRFQNAISLQRKQPMFYAAHALATFRAVAGATLPPAPWRNLPAISATDEVLLREAADDYQGALRLSPNDATFWSNLGWVESYLHREAEAKDAFKSAVLVEPQDAASRIGLGLLEERRGLVNEALEQYAQSLASSPRTVDSPFFADLKARNPSGATTVISRCLDIMNSMPSSPLVQASIAKVHAYQGRQQAASEEYTAALQQLPDLSYAWANLGSLDLALGKTPSAQVDFERALALYSWNRFAANKLAALAFSSGDMATARKLYTRTVLTPLLSIHANRTARVYHVPWVDTDDLIPTGLLEYMSPPIEPLKLCGSWWNDVSRSYGGYPMWRSRIASQQQFCAADANIPVSGNK
jgi:tetratricopeptide (TPR) repeat protein